MHAIRIVASVTVIAVSAFAQGPAPSSTPTSSSSSLDAFAEPVPIHTLPPDPLGGEYGTWTAAASFKASFHDGFAFYPWIPDATHTRGMHWRTTSIRLGGSYLLHGETVTRHDARRFERERGGIVERYDVRREGVEQSFVLAARPAGEGELVVEGAITTPFACEPVAARHGALVFHADGVPAMRYGEAFAFDAAGRRTTVATSFDGERIRLHVDAGFVAEATFPLTIDPLSTTMTITGSSQPTVATTITTASGPSDSRVYFGVVREFSASDNDAYVFLGYDSPILPGIPMFTDVTASWSTDTVDIAELAGASAWALAIEREFSTTVAARVFVQAFAGALNTGTLLYAPGNTTNPRIGGMLGTGTQALLLYGSQGDCMQQLVDGATPALGTASLHQAQATEWEITRATFPGSPWCVATKAGAVPTLRVRLVDSAGGLGPSHPVPSTNGASGPALDGMGTRFLLTWQTTSTSPVALNRISAQRFDLAGAAAPTFGPVRTVANTPLLTTFSRRDVAYDWMTQSHWVVGFHTRAALAPGTSGWLVRLGHTGGITETTDLDALHGTDTLLPCSCHSGVLPTGSHFAAAFGVTGATHQVLHRRLDYELQAGVSYYGTSCAPGTTLGDGHPPYAGSEFYRMNVFAPAGTICLHAIGLAPNAISLDPIGMLGCNMLVDSIAMTAVVADPGTGLASATYALGDSPVFLGDLYAQWFWIDAAANPHGWRSSVGARVRVR
jgi:hypothetical protein